MVAMLAHTHKHTHLWTLVNLLQHNTHLIAIETSSPVPFWPLSPCPRRLIGADCLLSCCKNFIEFIWEKKKGGKRQTERSRKKESKRDKGTYDNETEKWTATKWREQCAGRATLDKGGWEREEEVQETSAERHEVSYSKPSDRLSSSSR